MAKTKLPAVYVASELDQLAALKSRLRGRICDVVYNMGSATVHEIADQLGVPVSTLYSHLEMLVGVGLLHEGEPVRTTKNFARTYNAPARKLRVTHQTDNEDVREAIADVVASQLRFAEKEFRKAAHSEEFDSAGKPESRVRSGSVVGWLGAKDVRELNRLMGEVFALFEGTSPGPGRRLQGMTFVSRPIETEPKD
ncbi:MAG: winged helix-turn-helix domain-containing protein [Phycisphaerales bacterium JB061]